MTTEFCKELVRQMKEEEALLGKDFECEDCGYTINEFEFDKGKGRIMFNDVDDKDYVCGVCDDRCDDEGNYIEPKEDIKKYKELE